MCNWHSYETMSTNIWVWQWPEFSWQAAYRHVSWYDCELTIALSPLLLGVERTDWTQFQVREQSFASWRATVQFCYNEFMTCSQSEITAVQTRSETEWIPVVNGETTKNTWVHPHRSLPNPRVFSRYVLRMLRTLFCPTLWVSRFFTHKYCSGKPL